MKKVLFSLFFICMFLCPVFADYSVDAVSVSGDVSQNGRTQVTMTLQLSFTSAETQVRVPLPESNVSRVSAGDVRFDVEETDQGVDVILKKKDGFVGTQTFQITYRVPMRDSGGSETDTYTLGLLSSRWARDVGGCAFSLSLPASMVQLPEDFALAPEIQSGYHGTLTDRETNLSVTGNTLTGGVSDRMAYDSLSLTLELPEGYFKLRSATIPMVSISWLSVAMAAVLLLCLVYWRLKLRTPHVDSPARILAPEGILVSQLPMALDGQTCDVTALLLEWANLGYLSMGQTKSGQVYLTKNIPMGSERSAAEQKLFARIFGAKRRVAVTPGRYAGAAARYRASARKSLSKVIFDRTGGNLLLIQNPCRLLLAVAIGYMAYAALPEGGGFVILAVLIGLAGLIYSLYLHSALRDFFALRTITPIAVACWLLAAAVLVIGLLSGTFLEVLIGLAACLFSSLATARGPRRSQRGRDALAQVRGCRTFFRQASWQRLQLYQGRNRRFFQSLLPRAVALGVDKAFAKRFERLPVPVPEWLTISAPGAMSAQSLQKALAPILKQLWAAFR